MSTLKSDGIQPTLTTNNLIIRSGADVERLRIQPNGQILVASTTGTTFAGEVNFSNTIRIPGGVQVGGGIGPTRYTALDVVHTNTGLGLPDAVNYNTTRSRSNMMIQASGTNTTLFFGNNSSTSSWLQVQNSDNNVYGLALQPVGGNVGIGTASPTALLEVAGTGKFNSLDLTTSTHTVSGGAGAPAIHMRAFVCFNSENGGIYGSQNISSIVRAAGQGGVGCWDIYFNKQPPTQDAYVVTSVHSSHTGGGVSCTTVYARATNYVNVQFWVQGAPTNPTWACVAMYW
jgi:hypothetical protein